MPHPKCIIIQICGEGKVVVTRREYDACLNSMIRLELFLDLQRLTYYRADQVGLTRSSV